MVAMKNLTVQEETVDDAVLAAAVLGSQPEVDPRRVFILGHSLGAYVLPMILKQDPKAAGGIAMAGITRPLEDVVLEQVEYLIPLQSGQSEEARKEGQKKLEEIRRDVAALKALKPGQEDGPTLLGMPPHYLLALRGYDPAAVAASLHVPLLILQGERDYQVSMVDFAGWKAALGGRKDVELKSYPALNHLFVEGSGKSTPSEYMQPRHVAAEAIRDIAKWVNAH
jgi:dienelactone hydrolase